jgi:hypothetical protein
MKIRFVGVYDTVGSLGLPGELSHKSPHIRNIFGFNDRVLGFVFSISGSPVSMKKYPESTSSMPATPWL